MDANLNGAPYLDLLETYADSRITEILENDNHFLKVRELSNKMMLPYYMLFKSDKF